MDYNKENSDAAYFFRKKPEDYCDPFGFYLENERGDLVGGATVYKNFDWLILDVVYMRQEYRGSGYGKALFAKIDEFAKEKGLTGIHLFTLDIQGKGFYEKVGYTLIAEIKDFPKGHTRYEYIKYAEGR